MKAILSLSVNPLQCCGIHQSQKNTPSRSRSRVWRGLLFLETILVMFSSIAGFAAEKHSTWTTDASGLWTDSLHWNTPSYPANADTNLYSATIDMPNRTVTLDTSITLENLNLSRSILSGTNSPSLLLNGQLTLGPAQLIGTGALSANGLVVTGATKIVRGWKLENRGIGNWLAGDFRIGDGARLYNASTAGLNAACDATIVNDLGGTATMENAGMFRKSAGTNQTKIYVPFLNTGSLEVDSGELAFYGNSTNLGAHIEMLPGAALTFTGPHHLLDSSSTLTGQGGIIFDNGTVDFDAATDVKGAVVINLAAVNITPACTVTQLGSSLLFARSGSLDLNSGETISWNSMTMSNGILTGSDNVHTGNGGFQWLGGSIRGSGHFDIDGDSIFSTGSKTFRGWTMENHGAMQWLSGDVSTGEGCRFINRFGSSLQIGFDGNWLIGVSGGAFFDNFGAVQKSSGTNVALLGISFYNQGLVEVDSGTLRFSGALTNQGALAGFSGTTLSFASSSVQLTSFGSLDTDGSVVMESGSVTDSGAFRAGNDLVLKSGTLRFTNTTSTPRFDSAVRIAGLSTLDFKSGHNISINSLFQTNGTLTGSDAITISNQWVCSDADVDGTGTLDLWGQSTVSTGSAWSGRHLINHGDFSWLGGDFSAGLGFVFENGPEGTVYANGTGRFTTSTGSIFVNRGVFRKESGGTNQITLPFIGLNGRVHINSGQLQFTGGFTQTNGLLALNGTSLSAAKPLLNYGGTIAGNGDIYGSVFNAGTLMVGWGDQAGHMNISGTCTQAVGATLTMKLIDSNQFDSLAIGGQAVLGGKLDIYRVNDFAPQDGSTFPILTCATRTGQFSEVTGGDLPNGRKLVPVYTATGVNLVVSNTLPSLQLTIERLANTNAVKLSWSSDSPIVVLRSASNAGSANWDETFITNANNLVVPMTNSSRFFRLRQGP